MMKRLLIALVFSGMMLFVAAGAQANLILNGSFEDGAAIPGGYLTLGTGSTAIDHWTIGGGDQAIDYIGSFWTAADGIRSIDLNGYFQAGSVSQEFGTEVGQKYHVEFYMAGNPDNSPWVKALAASGGSVVQEVFTFDATGHTHGNMGWVPQSFDFIASGTSTTLMFESSGDPNGAWGAALDQVSVNPVPEPGTMLLLGSGLVGLAGWGRKKFKK